MTTIPARLARTTMRSTSPEMARKRVIDLYREWMRAAPEICTVFALNIPASQLRQTIRFKFEQHRHVTDPKVIDVLVTKSRMEYQEIMNCWAQEPHILGLLLDSGKTRPQRTFMQKFLEGRDEDAVIPAATGL
ncbi:uncharacterized protein STEHIDRAFT_148497 [Stereum hirsutum FP-91666 SS1]|uniref:uncharacterized protein n=1 Tax=Stereum hirsutum (strain FP-91666) TaxID=721885 RepID=UPI0004449608|nr:uncharacterized protein STEHIDRAFT_148497 [Stereum hirsutum FP-91666 SS1]EIM84460.1 hypothetical protein STEHIDRAFT_148497 [Stereum hirsutum FP-91666 SS1]